MSKVWKCGCGQSSNYRGLHDAVRYLTRKKTCSQCGGEMHLLPQNV